ncbi:hypothetical protein Bbelb_235100 [Branchiostoma belcheri]|nr:hypothetical protein Bbelb_235100 [Branchiostoma belcheri]
MVSKNRRRRRGTRNAGRSRETEPTDKDEAWHDVLHGVYYDPRHPAGYSGVGRLHRAVGSKFGISRKQVGEWLQSQDPYTLHKPIRRRFERARVIVGGMNDQFQADLVDMSSLSRHNDVYRYLLTCIDIFSKYAWVVPIKDKKGTTLVEAFQTILAKDGRKPRCLQTDQGTEFLNRHFQTLLKKEGIEFFTTFNVETKASVVERFNRTLKTKMWKYFTAVNTNRYIDVLDDLVWAYNHSHHRSIKRAPVDVNRKNENVVWYTLYGDRGTPRPRKVRKPAHTFRFEIGDWVRLSKSKMRLEKGYTPNWTDELFTIWKRIPRHPPVYRVKDYHGEELKGTFYEEELQKVAKKDDDIYQVEVVLDKRRRGKKTEYLVKWKGYPSKFNSWASDIAGQCLNMAASFYVTLPSDGSMDVYPDNTLSTYRTKLSHPIELKGDWEVSLSEIQYPHSWMNVREGDNTLLYFMADETIEGGGREYEVITVPSGYYKNISQLVKVLNEAAAVRYADLFKQHDMFAYNAIAKRVTMVLPPMVANIPTTKTYLTGPLAEKLGWKTKSYISGSWIQAPHQPDLNAGLESLYVYCDLIQDRLVGGVKVPLLRIVKVQGEDDAVVDHVIHVPQYLPLARRRFEGVEINIRNHFGQPVPFERGRLIVTLHFRQRRSSYFS